MKKLPWDVKIPRIFYVLATCLIFVGFLFFPSSNVSADEGGTYSCSWAGEGGFNVCTNAGFRNGCVRGFAPQDPDNPCSGHFAPKEVCESPHPCVQIVKPAERCPKNRFEKDGLCCKAITVSPYFDCTDAPPAVNRYCHDSKFVDFEYDEAAGGCIPTGGPIRASEPQFCDFRSGAELSRLEAQGNENAGIRTAIGCIPIRNTTEFVSFLLRWSIGIAGGIAFLLMLFASFQIMTSAGNPERLQGGRELLVAAISGLILIIFSVFLLRLIGFEILQLPGFG